MENCSLLNILLNIYKTRWSTVSIKAWSTVSIKGSNENYSELHRIYSTCQPHTLAALRAAYARELRIGIIFEEDPPPV